MKRITKLIPAGVLVLLLTAVLGYNKMRGGSIVLSDVSEVMEGQESFLRTDGTVSAVVYYSDKYMEDDEKLYLLETLSRGLGITGGMEMLEERDKNRETLWLLKSNSRSDTKIGVVTLKSEGGDTDSGFAHYITYNLNIKNSPESVCHYAELVRDQLKELGLSEKVTVTLVGYYSGELDIKQRSALADSLLDGLGAKVVAENRTKELFSVYAYADGLAPGISVGEDTINVNIAINYNEHENQTRLYLAAPVIDMEY